MSAITPEIEAMAGGAGSQAGTGGMVSKLAAAKIATRAGCTVVLAPGAGTRPLRGSSKAAPAPAFPRASNPGRARKEWIAGALGAMGVIRIDAGAARALRRGSSLLPAGVIAIEGSFERGDPVLVQGPGRPRPGQGAVGLRCRRRAPHPRPQDRGDRRRCWAIAAATS